MVLAQCLRAGKAPARLCTWHCWEGEEQGVMLRALEGARAFSLPPSKGASAQRRSDKAGSRAQERTVPLL